ncbi:MAG: hypothetical protein Q9162_005402 [Coniocarpon cinnabarinum]
MPRNQSTRRHHGLARALRLISIPTIVVIAVYFIYIRFGADSPSKSSDVPLANTPGGPWHDPNKDFIDEPSEPLHRVADDNYAPENPNSDRINATLLVLVRNSEQAEITQSMRDLERTWNHKFNYPWTFFNDEPFTAEFKHAVKRQTKAAVYFEQIPAEHWDTPPWINQDLFEESARILKEQNVQYADKISYRKMCRWNSALFAHHPALKDVQYYWRVEPHVKFFCDIEYDVFRFMRDHNKTYGFTINLYDSPQSISGLWPATEEFLADPANKDLLHPNNAMPWLVDSKHRPGHNLRAHGYSTCHFWSNFEIGDLGFWRGDAYMRYFNHLDRAGGFFYERWGDAPVHSIGLGLFEDRKRIHWFRDIGYNHIPYINCPNRPQGKCKGCETAKFTDGAKFLYKEDCRPSWFHHMGFGDWETPKHEA